MKSRNPSLVLVPAIVACFALQLIAHAQKLSLTPFVQGPFLNAAGTAPLASGKLYTYATGGTTPLATYSDVDGATPNANPVVLSSTGRANVFLTQACYRLVLKTSADVTVWDVDGLCNITQAGKTTIASAATTSTTWTIPGGTTDTFAGINTTQTLAGKTLVSMVVSSGIAAGGSGLKHQRFGSLCTTAASSVGAACNTTMTWTTAFPSNANYTTQCTLGGTQSGTPIIVAIGTVTTAGFVLRHAALTTVAATAAEADCIAVHD